VNRLSVDREALPAELLTLAKAQMRVEHTRDDALITQHLKDAINAVERRCNININPATFALRDWCWMWVPWRAPYYAAPLPVNNVVSIVSLINGGTDVAADYLIEQAHFGGNAEAFIVGPMLHTSEPVLTVEVGMDTADQLEPAVSSVVLRITAAYYESRESTAAVYIDDFASELAATWRPAV
jgi:hypothetical protein